MQWLQKGAITVFVLALSSLIFIVLTSDKKIRQQVLRPTLEALGEQLFAAVQDDVEKDRLEARYKTFVDEAEEQAIAPEKVEKVAARILNLRSRDSVISSADALKMLDEAHAAPAPDDPAAMIRGREVPHASSGFQIGTERLTPSTWSKEEMARRLKAMQEFQKQMELLSRKQEKQKEWESRYHFQPSDSGLRVMVDLKLRDALVGRDSLLIMQLRDLEKKRWLRWGASVPPPPLPGHPGDTLRVNIMPQEWAAWGEKVARAYSDTAFLRKLQRQGASSGRHGFKIEVAPVWPDSSGTPQP
ncbi:MAG TPA: hypothetical protein PKI62_00525 [bacterium]|nr:hypothetical protein [bacterium]HPR88780.1 hypothetical protein [bacterium]